jgi:hypothetical protein
VERCGASGGFLSRVLAIGRHTVQVRTEKTPEMPLHIFPPSLLHIVLKRNVFLKIVQAGSVKKGGRGSRASLRTICRILMFLFI